jgi:hypothetical protein
MGATKGIFIQLLSAAIAIGVEAIVASSLLIYNVIYSFSLLVSSLCFLTLFLRAPSNTVQEVTLVRIIFTSPAISSIPDATDLKSWSIHQAGKTVHYPNTKTEGYASFHGGEKRLLHVFFLTSYFE